MATENDALPATVKEAVDEIIANYKSLKPPFVCPIDRCAKPCLGLMSLKHHLLKIHKERLLHGGTSDDALSDEASEPTQNTSTTRTPNTGKEQPGQSLSKRKLKRKRKRWGTVRKPRPTPAQLAADAANSEGGSLWGSQCQNETVSPSTRLQNTVANMTYEESLRVSMFEVDGRTYRVEIDEPLKLEFVEAGSEASPPPVSATTAEQDAASRANQLQKPSTLTASAGGARAKAMPPKKLPEAEVRWFDNYAPLKSHKVPKEYREYEEKTAEELDREVEYVMDDLDYSWLRIYNAEHRIPRCLPEVSSKDFELLMDRLEKDSCYEPASQLGASYGGGPGGGGGGSLGFGAAAGSGVGDGSGVGAGIGIVDSTFEEDDAVCCICQDGEAANTNVILFCDMCNLPVHQECYGVPYIPEGQWVCRKCLLSPSHPVSCQLCPIKTGAFKQTSKNKWCHVSCALWIPEVHFANAVFLEPIENIENIPSARFKLCCYICKKRNAGASIQCSKSNCFTAFHIACGQSAGLHIKLEPVKDPQHSPTLVNVKKVAFCDVHTPADSDRKPLINSNPDDNESKEDQKRKSKKLKEIFAQKQGGAIQVCLPEIPADKYEEIVNRVDFPAKVQFLTRLTSYWLLRRQALNGVPLIKRLHMNHLQKQQQKTQAAIDKCENDNEEIADIKKTLANLRDARKVYEKARLLGEQVKKREKLKREWHQICEREFEICATSLYIILQQVMETLKEMDSQKFFLNPVDTSVVTDYRIVVDEPMDLSTMQKKLDCMQYAAVGEFARDFSLIIHNCFRYNNRETPYFKAAMKLKENGAKLIRHTYRFVNRIGVDPSTGLLTSKPPPINHYNAINLERALAYEPPPERYQDHIDYLSHFLDCAGENKLSDDHVNLVRQVIEEMTRGMLEWMDEDVQNRLKRHVQAQKLKQESIVSASSSVKATGSKRRRLVGPDARDDSSVIPLGLNETSSLRGEVPNRRSLSPASTSMTFDNQSPSGAIRRSKRTSSTDALVSTGKDSVVSGQPKGSGAKMTPPKMTKATGSVVATSSGLSNPSVVAKKGKPSNLQRSPSVASLLSEDSVNTMMSRRSSTSRTTSSNNDVTISNSTSAQKRKGGTATALENSKIEASSATGEEEEEEEDCLFQHMDFVWAKCRGFPSYPAIVIAPETEEGTRYNDIPIPVPPERVLNMKEQQNSSSKQQQNTSGSSSLSAVSSQYQKQPMTPVASSTQSGIQGAGSSSPDKFKHPKMLLVAFYETPTTWQWVGENQLEPLFTDEVLDEAKLEEPRKSVDKLKVRVAYSKARRAYELFSGQRDPVDEFM